MGATVTTDQGKIKVIDPILNELFYNLRRPPASWRDRTPGSQKNEALQVICATLLSSEKIQIKNIPNIKDVNNLIELLKGLGVKVTQNGF